MNEGMKVRFNAFHKDSSASYSKLVFAKSLEALKEEWAIFEKEVPFSRWYSENENESGFLEVDKWVDEID